MKTFYALIFLVLLVGGVAHGQTTSPGAVDCTATAKAQGASYPCTPPSLATPIPVYATQGGSGAIVALTPGQAIFGGWVSASVSYCVNYVGTAGAATGTPTGTICGWPANYPYPVPPTKNGVSIYLTTGGFIYGMGASS